MTTNETKLRLQHALDALREREIVARQIRTQHGTNVTIQCILEAFTGATDTLQCTDGFCNRNTNIVTSLDLVRVFEDARVKSVIEALKEAGFTFNIYVAKGQSSYCDINLRLRTFRLVHSDESYTSTEPPFDKPAEES